MNYTRYEYQFRASILSPFLFPSWRSWFNIYRNVVFVSAKETNTLQHFMNLQLETTPLCLESSSQAAEYLHSFLTLPSLAMDTKTVRSLARA